MNRLEWLVEVYVDYCDKHGLDHVSACEQSGLTDKQKEWIEHYQDYWIEAEDRSSASEKQNYFYGENQ